MENEDLGHLRKSYQKGELKVEDIQGEPMTFLKNGLLRLTMCLQ